MSEAASQTMIEYALADMIYHIENEGKLPEFWCVNNTNKKRTDLRTIYKQFTLNIILKICESGQNQSVDNKMKLTLDIVIMFQDESTNRYRKITNVLYQYVS